MSASDVDQIRRVLAEYCQFLDDRRYVEFGQLFAPDGVWLLGGRENRGPAAVKAFMDQLLLDHPNRRSSHMNLNISISLDEGGSGSGSGSGSGATATSSSDYVMFTRESDGPWGVLAVGRYNDRLARQTAGGVWRFVERALTR
jgi:hypothetical protein